VGLFVAGLALETFAVVDLSNSMVTSEIAKAMDSYSRAIDGLSKEAAKCDNLEKRTRLEVQISELINDRDKLKEQLGGVGTTSRGYGSAITGLGLIAAGAACTLL
jgi:hypothetical protein